MTTESKHPEALCSECGLSDRRYVPTAIPRIQQYKVLFVGEAPGEVESYTGVPFSGPAGKTHWGVLKAVGLKKEMLAHTNICACHPPDNRKPMYREQLCCLPRLKSDIHTLQPKLIIALGDVAMNALCDVPSGAKISSQRGMILDLKEIYEYKCKVLISFHPSFVMRQRQWIPMQAETYNLINKFFSKGAVLYAEPELTLDPSAEALKDYLTTDEPVACDLETTGLNPRQDQIIGISFSKDEDTAVAIAINGPDDQRWPVVKKFLQNKKTRKIWQNGSYDTSMLRYGQEPIIDQGFFFDTRLAEQLINSDLPSDLDQLRGKYTDIIPYKPPKSKRKTIKDWGKQDMLRYAALDAVTTLKVYKKQLTHLSKEEHSLQERLLIPLVYAIGRMENRGVLVDINCLAALYSQCAPTMERVEQQFGLLGVNPRSTKQLPVFFGIKGSGEELLEYYIKLQHPKAELMQDILDYRKVFKLSSVYLKGIFNRLENGRIHTHFKIEGTGTGRLSSQDPNLQNVPDEMRAIYIPDPGYVFVKGDHSQVELWVGAIVADEDQMLSDLQSGLDIHYISCQLCFPHVSLIHGNRKQDFTPQQQLIAKTVTFGTFYGRTPHSISREFGVTVAEATSWQLRLVNKYPKLASYRERCETSVSRHGYLTTPFGRRRYVASINQGYNFPVQSSASDITLGSIVEADRVGLQPVISVHDDILYLVKESTFDSEFSLIRKTMERPIPELKGIRFKIDYQKGYNWHELEKIDVKAAIVNN